MRGASWPKPRREQPRPSLMLLRMQTRVNLAAAALLDRVGLGKGAASPPASPLAPDAVAEPSARFRRLSDAELEQRIRGLEAEAQRGRVVVYLRAEDARTG